MEHAVVVTEVGERQVVGAIERSRRSSGEPRTEVTVLQAMTKESMDGVVDALTEVGASVIWPVITERTVARPDALRGDRRLERWRMIAKSAAQQSGRSRVPEVRAITPLSEGVAALVGRARILACVPDPSAQALSGLTHDPSTPLALCIGPEGGFSAREHSHLVDLGAEPVHLGPRVIRARLAGAVALALALGASGDLDRSPAPTLLDQVQP